MNVALALACLTIASQSPVEDFKAAFSNKIGLSPIRNSDESIQRCFKILATEARKKLKSNASTKEIAKFLAPFEVAIGSNAPLPSEYASLGVRRAVLRNFDAVGVRMGGVSRLFLWKDGKPLSVSPTLEWFFGFHAIPHFFKCGALAVDGYGIQDIGVRYAYRMIILSTDGASSKSLATFTGTWVLEEAAESHMSLGGDKLTLRSIDQPKSFFTTAGAMVFPRKTTFVITNSAVKTASQVLEMPAARAADAWMYAAQKATKPTASQSSFLAKLGKEIFLVDEITEKVIDSSTRAVILDDLKFTMKKSPTGWRVAALKFK